VEATCSVSRCLFWLHVSELWWWVYEIRVSFLSSRAAAERWWWWATEIALGFKETNIDWGQQIQPIPVLNTDSRLLAGTRVSVVDAGRHGTDLDQFLSDKYEAAGGDFNSGNLISALFDANRGKLFLCLMWCSEHVAVECWFLCLKTERMLEKIWLFGEKWVHAAYSNHVYCWICTFRTAEKRNKRKFRLSLVVKCVFHKHVQIVFFLSSDEKRWPLKNSFPL